MTRNELTQTEGTFENIAMNGDVEDWNVGASRWTKHGKDRLYFNDARFVDYVDLDSLIVETAGGAVRGRANIEGDTLTVSVSVHGGEKEMTATFALPDDLAEAPQPADVDFDGESVVTRSDDIGPVQPVVADGGRDAIVTPREADKAIEGAGSPVDVAELLSLLDDIQADISDWWDEHMDAVEENALEIVAIDGDTLVFADHTGQFWNEQFDALNIDHPETQLAISRAHHTAAKRHTDYRWSTDDPVVVRKPESFDAGERFVEACVTGFVARGLTPRQAWSVWGVFVGNSRNNWAARCGYDSHSGVSNAVREAKEKIPLGHLEG